LCLVNDVLSLLQGKYQSGIQMYKQYVMKASTDIVLPLYKISLLYRQLELADAEVEALQLVAKVCCLVDLMIHLH